MAERPDKYLGSWLSANVRIVQRHSVPASDFRLSVCYCTALGFDARFWFSTSQQKITSLYYDLLRKYYVQRIVVVDFMFFCLADFLSCLFYPIPITHSFRRFGNLMRQIIFSEHIFNKLVFSPIRLAQILMNDWLPRVADLVDAMIDYWKDLVPLKSKDGGRGAILFRCIHALMSLQVRGMIKRSLDHLYQTLDVYKVWPQFSRFFYCHLDSIFLQFVFSYTLYILFRLLFMTCLSWSPLQSSGRKWNR